MKEYMITTIDNPFNPFTQPDEWYQFDESKGYHTCQILAKLAYTSPELSEEDNTDAINQAVDILCKLNPLGLYKKLESDSED